MKRFLRKCCGVAALGLATQMANATEFVLINADPAGVGFNDATPAAPIGGNNGATLGEQRLNVYKRAFELWGNVLDSDVPVVVQATWAPLSCTATSGVLGSAGTTSVFSDFPQVIIPGHWYHSALADALAQEDLNPGVADIRTFFNINLGKPGCLQNSGWYYGLDNNEAPNQIDFLTVLMHEVAHGLGFSNFVNESTGVMLAGIPDVYTAHTKDMISDRQWNNPEMTDADRAASGLSVDKMAWNGHFTAQVVDKVLAAYTGVRVKKPTAIAGDYDIQTATFGPAATPNNFKGKAVYAMDAGGVSAFDGCEAITNAAAISGKIAVVDRGTCAFAIKVKNAQDAGAVAVIVVNNTTGLPGMGGVDPTITIPSIGVAQALGQPIKDAGLADVKLFVNNDLRVGAVSAGYPKLYAPAVYAAGSSGSHFDTTATPNLLMEPAINPDLRTATNVDLTATQFQDIGWEVGTFNIGECTTSVPSVTAKGDVLIGPVLQCADHAVDHAAFLQCTDNYLAQLVTNKVLKMRQKNALMSCVSSH